MLMPKLEACILQLVSIDRSHHPKQTITTEEIPDVLRILVALHISNKGV